MSLWCENRTIYLTQIHLNRSSYEPNQRLKFVCKYKSLNIELLTDTESEVNRYSTFNDVEILPMMARSLKC